MLNISYVSAFFAVFTIFVLGLGLGALIHGNVARKNGSTTAGKNDNTIVCFDYKVSKDYDRLYDLLNDGQTVLTRTADKTDRYERMFYNSWKGRDSTYYLNNDKETLTVRERFVLYCKFKDIEFLDFVDSK